MPGLLADTHAVVWYLLGDARLSARAEATLEAAAAAGEPLQVASISVVEIVYLVEKGKLPAQALVRLAEAASGPVSALVVVPLDLAVAQSIARIPRGIVSDPADRIIAATALHLGTPLITRDQRIHRAGVPTVW
jgi:PIN domain nuclease of toxin-antitoxin system